MANDGRYGVINEVGDLGLGFDPLSEKDQQTVQEQEKRTNGKHGDDRSSS